MSVQRIGGACAVVVGLTYVLVGITYLLLPNAQRPEAPSAVFLPSYAANPTFARLINWETAFGALFAVGAVMGITELVRDAGPGLARWTGNLAVIGFAATAISGFRALAVLPLMASSYVAADASAKAAIVANSNPNLDPDGWLAFGVVGVWAIVTSALALRSSTVPRLICYVGFAAGVLYLFVVAGNVTHTEALIAVAAGLGGVIVAPIWFVGIGLTLLRWPALRVGSA
jgi:uncharacterized protein DUF4386